MWLCIASLQLSQVQTLPSSGAFRCAEGTESHSHFNLIWVQLKKSVLPLPSCCFPATYSCLPYAVTVCAIVPWLRLRSWSGWNYIYFFRLIFNWSVYCCSSVHLRLWIEGTKEDKAIFFPFLWKGKGKGNLFLGKLKNNCGISPSYSSYSSFFPAVEIWCHFFFFPLELFKWQFNTRDLYSLLWFDTVAVSAVFNAQNFSFSWPAC